MVDGAAPPGRLVGVAAAAAVKGVATMGERAKVVSCNACHCSWEAIGEPLARCPKCKGPTHPGWSLNDRPRVEVGQIWEAPGLGRKTVARFEGGIASGDWRAVCDNELTAIWLRDDGTPHMDGWSLVAPAPVVRAVTKVAEAPAPPPTRREYATIVEALHALADACLNEGGADAHCARLGAVAWAAAVRESEVRTGARALNLMAVLNLDGLRVEPDPHLEANCIHVSSSRRTEKGWLVVAERGATRRVVLRGVATIHARLSMHWDGFEYNPYSVDVPFGMTAHTLSRVLHLGAPGIAKREPSYGDGAVFITIPADATLTFDRDCGLTVEDVDGETITREEFQRDCPHVAFGSDARCLACHALRRPNVLARDVYPTSAPPRLTDAERTAKLAAIRADRLERAITETRHPDGAVEYKHPSGASVRIGGAGDIKATTNTRPTAPEFRYSWTYNTDPRPPNRIGPALRGAADRYARNAGPLSADCARDFVRLLRRLECAWSVAIERGTDRDTHPIPMRALATIAMLDATPHLALTYLGEAKMLGNIEDDVDDADAAVRAAALALVHSLPRCSHHSKCNAVATKVMRLEGVDPGCQPEPLCDEHGPAVVDEPWSAALRALTALLAPPAPPVGPLTDVPDQGPAPSVPLPFDEPEHAPEGE